MSKKIIRTIDVTQSTDVLTDCEEAVAELQRIGCEVIICHFKEMRFRKLEGVVAGETHACVHSNNTTSDKSLYVVPKRLCGCDVYLNSNMPAYHIVFVGEL